jgi:hypothetical protein
MPKKRSRNNVGGAGDRLEELERLLADSQGSLTPKARAEYEAEKTELIDSLPAGDRQTPTVPNINGAGLGSRACTFRDIWGSVKGNRILSLLPEERQYYKELLGYHQRVYGTGFTPKTMHRLAGELRSRLKTADGDTDTLNGLTLRQIIEALTTKASGGATADIGDSPGRRVKLNPTKKRILSLCRTKAMPATAIAHKVELTPDHIRRVLAQMMHDGLLTNDPTDGYRTRRAT